MTHITVRPQRPGPELTELNARQLTGAALTHYHIARHLDAQVNEEMGHITAARRIGLNRLRRAIRRRAEAEEIFLLYLQEICRRVRTAKGLTDDQTDDELLHEYLRANAGETVTALQQKAEKIEAAATSRFWKEYNEKPESISTRRLLEKYFQQTPPNQ